MPELRLTPGIAFECCPWAVVLPILAVRTPVATLFDEEEDHLPELQGEVLLATFEEGILQLFYAKGKVLALTFDEEGELMIMSQKFSEC